MVKWLTGKIITVRRLILWSIIGIGISSIAVQLVVIREFLTQFQGNEMTISVAVFCWLLLTGMGSYSAKFIKPSSGSLYSILALITALWPLLQLIIIRHFREAVFIHGVSPGFYHILLFILATVAPYCLLSGFILPFSLNVLKASGYDTTSGGIYITDNIGDILGGIIFSFFLVYWATPFQAIAITSTLTVLTVMILQLHTKKNILFSVSSILAAAFYAISLNAGLELSSLSGQYGEIVKYFESPYGRIVITKEGAQHTFWESGLPLYSDQNIMESEERIHYPLSQLKNAGNILIVSGGLGQTIDEALKYKPSHIDYVELDPYLTAAAEEAGILKKSPLVEIINMDARAFIKNAEKKYDAIIINLPDPDTFQINRFYTDEFFSLAKRALSSNGVLSYSMEYSENYISRVRRQKLSSLYNTASGHFKNIEIIPGGRAYFICSDAAVSMDIPDLLKEKNIPTIFIEGYYAGNATRERIERIRASLDRSEAVNLDFRPKMISITLKEWFSQYNASPWLFIIILAVTCAVYLFFIGPGDYVIFSTGMAVMGVEMLIIFAFQVIYGYIYLKIGVIVTAFFLGLLPGSILGKTFKGNKTSGLTASEIALLFLLFAFLAWSMFLKEEAPQTFFFLYCVLVSFCGGFQFPIVTKIIGENARPAAGSFAADFTGAAVGTILVGAFIIPSLGIQAAIIFLILIKLSSGIVAIFSRRIKAG
jgi:spermidine synthase